MWGLGEKAIHKDTSEWSAGIQSFGPFASFPGGRVCFANF